MAGVCRRRIGYISQLVVSERTDKHINPLHLVISKDFAPCFVDKYDDDFFVCALRVERCDISPPSSQQSPSSSIEINNRCSIDSVDVPENPDPVQATCNFWSKEDIAVCVWALDIPSDFNFRLHNDFDTTNFEITLYCTSRFLSHYNLHSSTDVFIRPLQVFPISKAIFSVSNVDAYDWLQKEKFSKGLQSMICNNDMLVVQNDVLLSPYPDLFLEDVDFRQDFFFNIKSIACAPFILGVMHSSTEIIVYFEDEGQRLSSNHCHLSSSNLDKYCQGELYVSEFCRSLSSESVDGTFEDTSNGSMKNVILNACVIQQERDWCTVLSNIDKVDLNTIVGMPRKLMLQYGLSDGVLLDVSLVETISCPKTTNLFAVNGKYYFLCRKLFNIYLVGLYTIFIDVFNGNVPNCNNFFFYCPSRLRCPCLWLRTIAGKSTCGGSVAFPWEAHPKGGNYDGV